MTTSPQNASNATIDELRTLILEAEQALVNAGDTADEKLLEIRDRLKAILDSSKSTITRIRSTAAAQVRRADEVVRSHPYESIGIAVGLGALVGWLLTSRRSA